MIAQTSGFAAQPENKYHSQTGQDKFVNEHFFKNKRGLMFVDIGAYDGVTISNSLFFEKELGWNGLCIEPLPDIFKRLKANRSCTCLNICIADKNGPVNFMHVQSPSVGVADMLSGITNTYDTRSNIGAFLKEHNGHIENLILPAKTLNKVLRENRIKRIDYLSIDTEGNEYEILTSIDFNRFKIHIMTIENNYKDLSIREFLATAGFELVAILEQDEVYENKNWQ